MTAVSGLTDATMPFHKMYPRWGRNLTEADMGKWVVRTLPKHLPDAYDYSGRKFYDWSCVPNTGPIENYAIKLVAISGKYNDSCWLTMEEFRNNVKANPDHYARVPSNATTLVQKDAAITAELGGAIDFGGVQKDKRIVIVRDESTGVEKEYLIPLAEHLIVQQGDHVIKGQKLTERLSVDELQEYLVGQVQELP